MLNQQGNAVPRGGDHSHSRSDSGSYTYSTGSDEDAPAAATPAAAQQQQQQHQQQQQQQQQQFSPVSVADTKAKAKTKAKGDDKKKRKVKAVAKKTKDKNAPSPMEEEGDGGGEGNRRRGANLPGSAKFQEIASLATTPASADTQRVTIYLFFLFSFINMLFIVLSCVLSQLDVSGKGCYTFWGFKADCDSTSYTIRASLLQNKQLKQNLQAGAAMSILAVLTAVALFCIAWLLVVRARLSQLYQKKQRRYAAEHGRDEELFHDLDQSAEHKAGQKTASFIDVGSLKWITIGTLVGNLVFELIAWAIIAGLYSARPGENKELPRGMTYGVGFGLGITTWICELLMLAVFIFVV